MHEVLRADDCRSFIGHARKLSADVDAGTQVLNLRQHRGPIDPLSPRGAALSQNYAARIDVDKNSRSAGRSSLTRE
jgi:hypothetical protein